MINFGLMILASFLGAAASIVLMFIISITVDHIHQSKEIAESTRIHEIIEAYSKEMRKK